MRQPGTAPLSEQPSCEQPACAQKPFQQESEQFQTNASVATGPNLLSIFTGIGSFFGGLLYNHHGAGKGNGIPFAAGAAIIHYPPRRGALDAATSRKYPAAQGELLDFRDPRSRLDQPTTRDVVVDAEGRVRPILTPLMHGDAAQIRAEKARQLQVHGFQLLTRDAEGQLTLNGAPVTETPDNAQARAAG